ncbi:MAG: ATP-grasp domain-containing protein [Candidatus Woesearchaeota archaeon]
MKLKEYEGKRLFKKYGILIPKGKLITSVQEDPTKLAKAQVLSGKRKKQGLIAVATRENLKRLFKCSDELLLEEKLQIEKEYYLALTLDKNEKEVVILFSEEGGVEVETVKQIIKIPYFNLKEFPDKKFLSIIKSMYSLMKDYNALLVEINPLVLTKNKLIAADSKIILDDNVKYSEFEKKLSLLEKEAEKNGMNYVDLEGDIGIIGNGAGLVMATLDVVAFFGGRVANFLDLGGGASIEKMKKALDLVLKKNLKVVFINIFGGITRCDDIAKALVDYKTDIPLVVRIIGTNDKIANELLSENGIETYDSMEECAEIAVKYVNK